MEKPLSLTLLYTSNIRGDIRMLPRLYTLMQRLKPARRQGSLLLDLGHACADEVWHCRLTQGRSTLIVLDGMGYHAANVAGTLDPISRRKVAAQVTMALVDDSQDWHYQIPPVADSSITVALRPKDPRARLQICLSPAAATAVQDNILYLRDVGGGQIGWVHLTLHPVPRLVTAAVHDLPPHTPANPSLAAAVEFVESEAHYYHQKR